MRPLFVGPCEERCFAWVACRLSSFPQSLHVGRFIFTFTPRGPKTKRDAFLGCRRLCRAVTDRLWGGGDPVAAGSVAKRPFLGSWNAKR